MSFAADTVATQIGPGRFTAELHERWSSLVGIHGGYTAAIVANAMTTAVDDPSRALRSFATQFASIPRPGPVDVEVTVERAGKSMTTTSARLLQEGKVLQIAHAASSKTRPGLAYNDHVRPRGADPGDTPRFSSSDGVGHFENADVRLDPGTVLFAGGREALVAAWLRPLDGEPIDAAWLVAMCDLLPPAIFSRTTGPVTIQERFIVWNENETWAFTATAGPPVFEGLVEQIEIREVAPGRSQITYRMAIQPRRWLRIPAKMVASGVRKNLTDALRAFPDAVERRR